MTEYATDVKRTFGRVSLDNLRRLAESGSFSALRTKNVTDVERIETALRWLFNELADLKKERDAREASQPKPIVWLRQRARRG